MVKDWNGTDVDPMAQLMSGGVMSERRDEIKRTKRARSDDRWSCNCCCLGREKKECGIVE